MQFEFRHWNRAQFPTKHLLVVEDDLNNQKRIAEHLTTILEPQGDVQVSFVPGGVMAAGVISQSTVDLIIGDHDLPNGNIIDLISWMKKYKIHIPIISFSGIPSNNERIMHYSSQADIKAFHYQKEDVINGKADDVIRKILRVGIAETYLNTYTMHNLTIPRYWVTPNLLVGGNVLSEEDYKHLKADFGINAVINVDGIPDADKGIENLLEIPVPDDGTYFSKENVLKACDFFTKHASKPVYVHCHLGMSRSPHFVYSILRKHYNMLPELAYQKIQHCVPESNKWGFNAHTKNYVASIEEALK